MPQATTQTHIGRQSRPNLREKARFCEVSGDVKNEGWVCRFLQLYTVISLFVHHIPDFA